MDLFHFLQTRAGEPLDFHVIDSQLSQQMKAEIAAAFMRRNQQSPSSAMIWQAFASGQPTLQHGPIGEDLLLGNVNIWGIDQRSAGGYSVLHLA